VKHYFVTGATGVVGSSLVQVLLGDPEVRVTLLIRAATADELAARLERLFAFWNVPRDDAATRSRVVALAGDTTLPRFGLDDAEYGRLSARCTHVVHAAGLVRMNLPLQEARRSAVDSVANVVELARACAALRKVDVVSTVGVGGRLQQAIPERWLTEPRAFHNTYEQAKAEAEDFLREQVARTPLPLTVHRPSMVVGDSRSGRIISFQVFYFLCEFLSGRRTLGLYPAFGDARLDVIGCDLVADAIAAASNDPQTAGRVLHLCSGPRDAVRIGDLKAQVRQAFASRGLTVPADRVLPRHTYATLATWASRVAPARARKALATLPIYLDYLADSQAFDDTQFLAWLAARGRHRPAPAQYLPRVLDYYLGERYGVAASCASAAQPNHAR
jgi:thioester reductase-like protein